MPKLSVKVTEKWTNIPIRGAEIYINDIQVMSAEDTLLRSNNEGEASIELTVGTAKVCATAPEYETTCQTLNMVANTSINIIMTPIVRAL